MELPTGFRPTTKALMECNEAMHRLWEIGWPDSMIPTLEKLWWEIHDEHGRIRSK
jgi:hypothetical protein